MSARYTWRHQRTRKGAAVQEGGTFASLTQARTAIATHCVSMGAVASIADGIRFAYIVKDDARRVTAPHGRRTYWIEVTR